MSNRIHPRVADRRLAALVREALVALVRLLGPPEDEFAEDEEVQPDEDGAKGGKNEDVTEPLEEGRSQPVHGSPGKRGIMPSHRRALQISPARGAYPCGSLGARRGLY